MTLKKKNLGDILYCVNPKPSDDKKEKMDRFGNELVASGMTMVKCIYCEMEANNNLITAFQGCEDKWGKV